MTANKPKAQRGIFGFVETLVYALEQQGRLFVHHHGVAWIAGLPTTHSDWERLPASDELRAKFERYCASIFAAELPVFSAIDTTRCPSDECDGQLDPEPIPKKFKHILKPTVPAPVVARCDGCENSFTEPEIVRSAIDKEWRKLSSDNQAVSTETAVRAIRHKFRGSSRHAATARVQLSRLLLKDQVHTWTHTHSCVKGRVGTKCRYKFHRKLEPRTELNRKDEIVFRRRVGNQWLNPYVKPWRRVLYFNMDARILWSGQGLQATRYALQHAIKRQTVLDNVAVVDMAFKRRVTRELEQQTTEYSKAIGRLLSLAYSPSGVMEIGGPLATVIMHVAEAVTFGCTFERLALVEGLNLLNRVVVEAAVSTRNHEMFAKTSISMYINRPRCLEGLCWYDFCSWICRSAGASSHGTRHCVFSRGDESQLRGHVKVHHYQYLEYPMVPEIVGPRLPDRRDSEMTTTKNKVSYTTGWQRYSIGPFATLTRFLAIRTPQKGIFRCGDRSSTRRLLDRSNDINSTMCVFNTRKITGQEIARDRMTKATVTRMKYAWTITFYQGSHTRGPRTRAVQSIMNLCPPNIIRTMGISTLTPILDLPR